MAISNDIKREVRIRIKTYEKRHFDVLTGESIEKPEWKLLSEEANYKGLGVVSAIRWLLGYLKD